MGCQHPPNPKRTILLSLGKRRPIDAHLPTSPSPAQPDLLCNAFKSNEGLRRRNMRKTVSHAG